MFADAPGWEDRVRRRIADVAQATLDVSAYVGDPIEQPQTGLLQGTRSKAARYLFDEAVGLERDRHWHQALQLYSAAIELCPSFGHAWYRKLLMHMLVDHEVYSEQGALACERAVFYLLEDEPLAHTRVLLMDAHLEFACHLQARATHASSNKRRALEEESRAMREFRSFQVLERGLPHFRNLPACVSDAYLAICATPVLLVPDPPPRLEPLPADRAEAPLPFSATKAVFFSFTTLVVLARFLSR